MDERLRCVTRLLDGEAMSEVSRAFGISRKTGYKIFERRKEHGFEALSDLARVLAALIGTVRRAKTGIGVSYRETATPTLQSPPRQHYLGMSR